MAAANTWPEHGPCRVHGGAVATRECLARYGGLVWSIARRFEYSDVQELFLDLWKSAGSCAPTIASETAFVAMIARRRLIDRRRSQRRRLSTEQMPELKVNQPVLFA